MNMKRFILIVCTLFLCCLGFSQNSEAVYFLTGGSVTASTIILNDEMYELDSHVSSFIITEITCVNADTCKVSLQGFYNKTTASIFYNLYIKKGDKIQFKKILYAPDGNIVSKLNLYQYELFELNDFTFNKMILKVLK